MQNTKFLVIQTAFIGDAILATSLLEKLHQHYPNAQIDFLIRKGNEGLFEGHPFINHLIIWDKKGGKYKNLLGILKEVRKAKYDYLVNLQRFASTGLFASFSKAEKVIGFKKNPFSFMFDIKVEHEIGNGKHEVERNQLLISSITDNEAASLKLHPDQEDFKNTEQYKSGKYITISPASVWFTKQFPKEKWIEFIKTVNPSSSIFLLGGPGDKDACNLIKEECKRENIIVLAGTLSFLETAALMKDAEMNYTNDSAPLHIASAMNAPTTAVFCSTIPDFGFGPLASNSKVVEVKEKLACRPCGLHGKKECPEGHFNCAYLVDIEALKF
jgi:ADP-heptose:LPS heptosyltransferase